MQRKLFQLKGEHHSTKHKIQPLNVSGGTSFQQMLLMLWYLLEAPPKTQGMKRRKMLTNDIAKNGTVSPPEIMECISTEVTRIFLLCWRRKRARGSKSFTFETLPELLLGLKGPGLFIVTIWHVTTLKIQSEGKTSWTELHRAFKKCIR